MNFSRCVIGAIQRILLITREVVDVEFFLEGASGKSHQQQAIRFWCRSGSRFRSRNFNGIFTTQKSANCRNFAGPAASAEVCGLRVLLLNNPRILRGFSGRCGSQSNSERIHSPRSSEGRGNCSAQRPARASGRAIPGVDRCTIGAPARHAQRQTPVLWPMREVIIAMGVSSRRARRHLWAYTDGCAVRRPCSRR